MQDNSRLGITDTASNVPTSASKVNTTGYASSLNSAAATNLSDIPQETTYNEWNKNDWWKALLDPFDLGGWRKAGRDQASSKSQRDWELYMSNTAVQRRMKDLQAAGLNPLLAATSAFQATTPQGVATAPAKSGGTAALIPALLLAIAKLLA